MANWGLLNGCDWAVVCTRLTNRTICALGDVRGKIVCSAGSVYVSERKENCILACKAGVLDDAARIF